MTDEEVLDEARADGFELEERACEGAWAWGWHRGDDRRCPATWSRGGQSTGCATGSAADESSRKRSRAGIMRYMPLILVSGISGSGKSAVCVELQKRGYEAHDTDLDGNAVWVDRETGETTPGHSARSASSPEWFEKHEWRVVPEKVEALAEHASTRTVFLCGMTANEREVWHLFARVVYLSTDAQTIRDRVASRTTNDFGKTQHEMAAILDWHEVVEEQQRQSGAVIIDATRPLSQVVGDVISAATDGP
jgi:dephospho-CoA kinase